MGYWKWTNCSDKTWTTTRCHYQQMLLLYLSKITIAWVYPGWNCFKIKCLYSKSNISSTETCDHKTFLFNLVNGMTRLRKSTIIIIMQSVMAITGTKKNNFIVYKNETLHIEFEEERWYKDILPSLRKLMFYSRIRGQHPISDKKVTVLKKRRRLKFIYTRHL